MSSLTSVSKIKDAGIPEKKKNKKNGKLKIYKGQMQKFMERKGKNNLIIDRVAWLQLDSNS